MNCDFSYVLNVLMLYHRTLGVYHEYIYICHFESIILVVGDFQTFMNLLLCISDWYTGGWHKTELVFQG